jgi:diguanylate cyclase (GGDEF)-like protein
MEFLDRELARSGRYTRPLSLVMIDIDLFRQVNENLGHLGGDFTLRELAARMKGNIRKEELFARYGGEEFAAVLPETPTDGAVTLAERLRVAAESQPFRFEDKTYNLTVSLGVATTAGDTSMTPADLIRIADEKLYQAKSEGRNRVCS